MTFVVWSLLFSLTARAIEPRPDAAPAPTYCAALLTHVDADALRRAKITPELLATAEAADPQLVSAIRHVLGSLDDRTAEKIAMNVIDDPVVEDPDEIARNPFYVARPKLRRAYADKTLVSLRDAVSDRFDDYELGLLSYLIADLPRGAEGKQSSQSGEANFRKMSNQVMMLAKSETYQPILTEFLRRMSTPERTTRAEEKMRRFSPEHRNASFGPGEVEDVITHLSKGRTSHRDTRVVLSFIMSCLSYILNESDPIPFVRKFDQETKRTYRIYTRADRNRAIDERLGNFLGLSESLDRFSIMLAAVTSLDPLPVPTKQLITGLVSRVPALLEPFRRYQSRTSEPSIKDAPRVTHIDFVWTDHFAPRVDSASRRRNHTDSQSSTSAGAAQPRAWNPEDIDPSRGLSMFTGFVADPRPIDQLTAGEMYDFWYRRESSPRPRRVRFSKDAVTWLKSNPITARRALNALHMGETRGSLSGIKYLQGASRRFDGSIYEIKIRDNHRGLMILVDGVWEVHRFSPKDHVDHDLRFLTPLDQGR